MQGRDSGTTEEGNGSAGLDGKWQSGAGWYGGEDNDRTCLALQTKWRPQKQADRQVSMVLEQKDKCVSTNNSRSGASKNIKVINEQGLD